MARGTTGSRTSLWRLPAVRALAGATVLGFTSFTLTLASLPVYAVAGGAAADTAGLVTAVFLAVTVAGQSAVPALTARYGPGPVLAAGLVALGAPSPLYAVDDGLLWLSAVSAVRGLGFAVLTVLGATLAARVAPRERRGESIGLYGLAIAVPNLVCVPAGVALVLGGHAGWMAWLAASPVLALPLVPAVVRGARADPPAGRSSSRAAVRAALTPSAVLLVVTLAGGGLVTFLPIERPDGVLATAALLVFGITAALGRWRAGVVADRTGTRLLLPLALLGSAAGLAAVALGLGAGAGWVLAGAAVFGAGYGAVQNLTLVTAFARAGEGGATAASAMWNASFDAGTAVGALVLGLVAGGIGLPWTYVLAAGVLLLTLPLARVAVRPA
ncbi:Predicted arabinose efflux permease, MFS family [Geodermatophilus africanus]|uniref:Predicted arabinose efflux permease, MFS family n=1 Tax=Geodermatophilus africanus TaxID=1137993 RepID=A0A1H3NLJ6_9ACTN|nr:MFS transporter [Geodermatophilus africanus]SDY89771.1 Predicted arabinose efflux permease, MFS family [Geodermatophilus africanus]